MKKLIKNIIIIVIITCILCSILGAVGTIIMPTFTNDMAMDQMENDDVSFMLWQTWTRVQNIVFLSQGLIIALGLTFIGVQIYKYFQNKKENN